MLKYFIGLVLVFLTVIFTQTVNAHGPEIDGTITPFATDNFIRESLDEGTIIKTAIDGQIHPFTFPISEANLMTYMDRFYCILSFPPEIVTPNADCEFKVADSESNVELLNVTFITSRNITNYHTNVFFNVGGGGGTVSVSQEIWNTTTIVRYDNLSLGCGVGVNIAKEISQSRSFDVKKVILRTSTTGCAYSIYVHHVSLWNSGSKTLAINHTDNYLEYADWLVRRMPHYNPSEQNNGSVKAATIEPLTNSTVLVPSGTSYLFLSAECDTFQTIHCFETNFIVPKDGIIQTSSQLSWSFLGLSQSGRSNKTLISVWRVVNSGNPFTLSFEGNLGDGETTDKYTLFNDAYMYFSLSSSTGCTAFADRITPFQGYPATSEICQGTLGHPLLDSMSSIPRVVKCYNCTGETWNFSRSYPFDYIGILYQSTNGPLATVPESGIDLDNKAKIYTHIPVIDGSSKNWSYLFNGFTLTLHPYRYFGNAIYLAHTGQSEDICDNSTVSVNAISGANVNQLRLSDYKISQGITGTLQDVFFVGQKSSLGGKEICLYLIDDFSRSLNIGLDALGNNQYLATGLPVQGARTYTLSISETRFVELEETSLFDDLQVPVYFVGTGSQRLQCESGGKKIGTDITGYGDNVSLMGWAICFGNLDTGSTPLATETVSINWNWTVKVAETGATIEGARIFEVITGAQNISNSLGQALLSTTTTQTRWTVTKLGFNQLSLNFTSLSARPGSTIYLTALLSNRPATNKTSESACFQNGTNEITCEVRQVQAPGQNTSLGPGGVSFTSCEDVNIGNLGTCDGIANKVYGFSCPTDTQTKAFISLVEVVEETSRFGITTGKAVVNTEGLTTCPVKKVDVLGSSNLRFTWSKEGYRTITLDGPFTSQRTDFVVGMTEGLGQATRLKFTNFSAPLNFSGVFVTRTIVVVNDIGDAEKIDTGVSDRGTPPIEKVILDIASSAGFGSVTGKALWGLILIVGTVVFMAFLWRRATGASPDGTITAAIAFIAFFAFSMLGLFPEWLLITVVATVLIYAWFRLGGFSVGSGDQGVTFEKTGTKSERAKQRKTFERKVERSEDREIADVREGFE